MEHIKKIKLITAMAELEVDLKFNSTVIGFDVAEHATGIAIIATTNDYLILKSVHKITVPKKIVELEAIDLFTDQLDDFKRTVNQTYKFDKTVIENCYVRFNPQTAIWLARFGIIVYDRFKHISKNSELILPNAARKNINFKKSSKEIKGIKLKKEIIAYINNALQTEIKDNDIADACVLALSGLVIKE